MATSELATALVPMSALVSVPSKMSEPNSEPVSTSLVVREIVLDVVASEVVVADVDRAHLTGADVGRLHLAVDDVLAADRVRGVGDAAADNEDEAQR